MKKKSVIEYEIILEKVNKMTIYLLTRHLISFGMYENNSLASVARRKRKGPKYVRLRNRVFYPKKYVIQYIKQEIEDMKSIESENDE